MKRLIVIVVASAALAATTAAGSSAGSFGCKPKIDGHAWFIQGNGMTCNEAKAVVTKLSRMPSRGGFFKGTYAGMRCASTTPPGQKPVYIACADGRGKNINAFRS